MKPIKTLWSDPVGWAETVAKTKLRVFLWILVHIVFVTIGLAGIHILLRKAHGDSDASAYIVPALAGPIVIIGVYYPAMYLYAMYRLLKIAKEAGSSPHVTEL